MDRLNAQELRTMPVDEEKLSSLSHHDITIICEDVLDTYNVGSIFRLADAVCVDCIYLCGQTQTPPNTRIKKASINTWQWVKWIYKESAPEAIEELRREKPNICTYALEQDARSISFGKTEYRLPAVLVVGNESTGVKKETLDLVDEIIELPMFGINVSLNVMVTTGIVLYDMVKQLKL